LGSVPDFSLLRDNATPHVASAFGSSDYLVDGSAGGIAATAPGSSGIAAAGERCLVFGRQAANG